jgi:ABC-2 type transport system permease protein
MNPRNVFLVFRREFRVIIFSKGFLLGTFIPILILSLIAGLMLKGESILRKSTDQRTEPYQVGVIGSHPELNVQWKDELKRYTLENGNNKYTLVDLSVIGIPQETLLANARDRVLQKKLDAYILITGDLVSGEGNTAYYSRRGFIEQMPRDMHRTLSTAVQNIRLQRENLDTQKIRSLMNWVSWNAYEVVENQDGDKNEANFLKTFIPAFSGVLIMFFLVFGSAQRLLQSIIEEKTSRIVEILLSSVSATELFAGKVFALYVISILQFLIWFSMGFIILIYKNISIFDYISPHYLGQYVLYLTTGYLTYAALFAMIGNLVGNESESQPFQAVISICCILPMMLNMVIVSQPNWLPIRIISYIPIFTPTVMAFRLIVITPPLWETVSILLVSLVSGLLLIWLAGRAFRVGVLMTGKKTSIREVLRWSFYRDNTYSMEEKQ